MKKYISLAFAGLLMAGVLSTCRTISGEAAETGKIQIVTTIFPEYDWVMNILGDNPAGADVTMLLDSGVDLHSFQPTAKDILTISTCDLFIYVGGESDEWVDDVLEDAMNKDMIVINLLDVLGDSAKEEELVEGMQEEEHDHSHSEDDENHAEHNEEHTDDEDHADHEEEHGDEHEDADHEDSEHEGADYADSDHADSDHADSDHEGADHADSDHEDAEHKDGEHENGETEYDEHVWLSLKNAAVLVANISEAIQKLDADNADTFSQNTAAYIEKLNALDAEYQAAVSDASFTTLLFGDRFPFRYMVDDYGLSYFAAFSGCSAECEASFETITFLASKVDELSLPAVMTIEGTDHRIAETIVQTTQTKDQKILTMDSMQATTAKDVENGASYLSIMEKNLAVLQEALK